MVLDPKTYKAIVKFKGGKCEICGGLPENIHHIDRNRYNDNPRNLMLLCKSCHLEEHKKIRKKALDDGRLWSL